MSGADSWRKRVQNFSGWLNFVRSLSLMMRGGPAAAGVPILTNGIIC